MKTINTKNQIQRITKFIATGVLVAAPFLSVLPTAEAQPRWNQGRNNNNDWGRTVTTFEGTVTRDLYGDAFDVRTDNGRIVQVRVGRYEEPRSLNRGDYVRVTGQMRNGAFVASNIQFIRDTGNGNNNGNWQNSITGVVTRDLAGKSFELRTDNGRTVHVNFGRYDEPRSLDRGDRVRVNGRYEGNIFRATDVQFLSDTRNNNGGWNNGGGWGNNQQTTTLTGVVTRDFSGDNFELRTDTGRTISVRVERGREPRSLDRGDRVRVTGRFTNNTFIARDLDILRDTRR